MLDILKKFCSDDPFRNMQEPFRKGEFTYATNGHILIKIFSIQVPDNNFLENTLDVEKVYNEAVKDDLIEYDFSRIKFDVPKEPVYENLICDICNGEGDCTCDKCGYCHDCSNCGGKGTLRGKKIGEQYSYGSKVRVNGVFYNAKYWKIIQECFPEKVLMKQNGLHATYIKALNAEILICPLKSETTENIIAIIDAIENEEIALSANDGNLTT